MQLKTVLLSVGPSGMPQLPISTDFNQQYAFHMPSRAPPLVDRSRISIYET